MPRATRSRRTAPPYHHGDLRDALLREARTVVHERGPEGLSLRQIARTLGVSEAAPYHHFRDRREIVAVLATEGFEAFGAAVRPAVAAAGPDPVERLVAFGEVYVRFAIEDPGAFRTMFGSHVVELDLASVPELYAAGHPLRELLVDLAGQVAERSGGAVSREEVFASSWALVHGIAWLHLHREFPDAVPDASAAVATTRRAARALLVGLIGRGARRR